EQVGIGRGGVLGHGGGAWGAPSIRPRPQGKNKNRRHGAGGFRISRPARAPGRVDQRVQPAHQHCLVSRYGSTACHFGALLLFWVSFRPHTPYLLGSYTWLNSE